MALRFSSARWQLVTALALFLSISGTFAAWHWAQVALHNKSALELNNLADEFQTLLEGKLARHIALLEGVQGLFSASSSVERNEFNAYFDSFKSPALFRGLVWVVYAQRIADTEKEQFIESVRNDISVNPAGNPDFTIHPEIKKEEYLPVKYFHPINVEKKVFGFDFFSDPKRSEVILQAVDSGQITASSLLDLKTGLDSLNNEKGIVISGPIYKNHAPVSTVAERRSAWIGVANSLLNIQEIILAQGEGLSRLPRDIGVEIYSLADAEAPKELIYRHLPRTAEELNSRLECTKRIDLGGRIWEVHLYVSRGFGLSTFERGLPWAILAASVVFGSLLCGLLFLLVAAYRRNIELTAGITEQLHQSKERLGLALLASGIGMWDWDIVNDRVTWDEAAAPLVGFESAALTLDEFSRLVHPQDRERFRKEIEDCLKGEVNYESIFRIVRPDGRVIVQSARGKVYRDKDNKPFKLTGAAWDITTQKKAEEAMRRSEINYRTVIENSSDGILIIGQGEGQILFANRAAAKLFERSVADLLGTQFGYPIIGDKVSEINLIQKGGKRRIAELSMASTRWEEKSAYLVSLRDITERKNLEAQFIQSQKMEAVGRLTGGIAHDFNNLLTVINGYTEMSIAKVPEGDRLRTALEEIAKAGARAAALTHQLLAFSRQQVYSPKKIELNALIHDLDKMLRRLLGEDMELVIKPQDDLWTVKIDPSQMEQVLVNLAVNARDAMPKGGRLSIGTANVLLREGEDLFDDILPGEYVVLSVSDNGTGMSEEVKKHIFEPFFTTKEKGKGTGLGLATCYGIIKRSDGYLRVSSAMGMGTTFEIYLPRASGASEKLISQKPVIEPPRGSETILLVEDEGAVREMAVAILTGQGYRVLEAENGDAGLRVLRENENIQLAVVDVVMPKMGGGEFAEHARVISPKMKILFISGYTDDEAIHHGVEKEKANFMQKPFTPTALIFKVRELLDNAQAIG